MSALFEPTMSDPLHEKFARLIDRVEGLEDKVSEMEGQGGKGDSATLAALREQLQQARDELARVSNGCGSPRPGI